MAYTPTPFNPSLAGQGKAFRPEQIAEQYVQAALQNLMRSFGPAQFAAQAGAIQAPTQNRERAAALGMSPDAIGLLEAQGEQAKREALAGLGAQQQAGMAAGEADIQKTALPLYVEGGRQKFVRDETARRRAAARKRRRRLRPLKWIGIASMIPGVGAMLSKLGGSLFSKIGGALPGPAGQMLGTAGKILFGAPGGGAASGAMGGGGGGGLYGGPVGGSDVPPIWGQAGHEALSGGRGGGGGGGIFGSLFPDVSGTDDLMQRFVVEKMASGGSFGEDDFMKFLLLKSLGEGEAGKAAGAQGALGAALSQLGGMNAPSEEELALERLALQSAYGGGF